MSVGKPNSGRFIVLEGPDGGGKSTQAGLLVDALEKRGLPVLHLREPGGTAVGESIRGILLDPVNEELTPLAEAMLYMASRAQLAATRIRPALDDGTVVVCERWIPSTVCYQGYAGGVDPESIWSLGAAAAPGLLPDLTLILDVDPAVGLSRTGEEPDLMERRSIEFHARVREGYRTIFREGRMNARWIDAGEIPEVAARIAECVEDVL